MRSQERHCGGARSCWGGPSRQHLRRPAPALSTLLPCLLLCPTHHLGLPAHWPALRTAAPPCYELPLPFRVGMLWAHQVTCLLGRMPAETVCAPPDGWPAAPLVRPPQQHQTHPIASGARPNASPRSSQPSRLVARKDSCSPHCSCILPAPGFPCAVLHRGSPTAPARPQVPCATRWVTGTRHAHVATI